MPRTKKPITGLQLAFSNWAQEAEANDEFVYHLPDEERDAGAFAYARKLQHAGLVMLFQRRGPKGFSHIAKRSPVFAHVALDALSKAIPAPPKVPEEALNGQQA